MEKFFSGAKLQIIFHTLAFLPLFCIKQEQNIFLERKKSAYKLAQAPHG